MVLLKIKPIQQQQMQNNPEKIDSSLVENRNVIDMITVANEFCLFVEEHEKYEREYILVYLQRILPLLYLRGSLLDIEEPAEESENERFVTEDAWEYVFLSFKHIFDKENLYYFWNTELKEPTETSLAENIADLYQDMKDTVFLFSKSSHYAKHNAVYLCKTMFAERWGSIIPSTLTHLHGIIYVHNANSNSFE